MRNCWKYIKTKLFRALVGVRKHDQGASKAIYHYVPIQDFTEHSDIDWSKSVAEIDAQLYKKYNLTPDEITFIETMIKPME
jgi:type II restriction enzyme